MEIENFRIIFFFNWKFNFMSIITVNPRLIMILVHGHSNFSFREKYILHHWDQNNKLHLHESHQLNGWNCSPVSHKTGSTAYMHTLFMWQTNKSKEKKKKKHFFFGNDMQNGSSKWYNNSFSYYATLIESIHHHRCFKKPSFR